MRTGINLGGNILRMESSQLNLYMISYLQLALIEDLNIFGNLKSLLKLRSGFGEFGIMLLPLKTI
jgi:hypothetical protein